MFKNILGQKYAITVLSNALNNENIAHSYLFFGPNGVGKKKTAFEFAKLLNCKSYPKKCDGCSSCKKIEKLIHPDIFYIEPDGASIKIDQVKKMQEAIRYRPFEGKKKIVIISDVQKMVKEASNAFLKTLEEPPADTVFILLCVNRYELLNTIISRCQSVRFNLLSDNDIKDIILLNNFSNLKNVDTLITYLQGSVSNILDLEVEDIENQRRDALIILSDSLTIGTEFIFDRAKTVSFYEKSEIFSILENINLFVRDILLIKNCVVEKIINKPFITELSKISEYVNDTSIYKIFELIKQTESNLKRNVNTLLSLELMMLKINELRVSI